ncbi:MAG TPA: sulfite exporter TauE/SafE family protein [Bacillota bacterium]|nr:sulfite exporter TauE/SafE family protein [Bacillota bacterium]
MDGILLVYMICILIGMLTAFTGSLIGIGGGVILIPTLLFLHKYVDAFAWATPQMIVGVSLMVMIFTALSSTISYLKKGRVDYKTGWLFLTGSIPGGIAGSWISKSVDVDQFTLYFGLLMIVISLLFFLRRKGVTKPLIQGNKRRTFEIDGNTYEYSISVIPAFIISLTVGVLSGLFGIGGGAIMVPSMILLFGYPAHIAAATSMFMILFISTISASTHLIMGHVVWQYVLFFIPAAYIGGKIGAFVNQRLKGNTLEWVLRILLVVIGFRLIFDGLT